MDLSSQKPFLGCESCDAYHCCDNVSSALLKKYFIKIVLVTFALSDKRSMNWPDWNVVVKILGIGIVSQVPHEVSNIYQIYNTIQHLKVADKYMCILKICLYPRLVESIPVVIWRISSHYSIRYFISKWKISQ